MKKLILALPLMLSLAACQTTGTGANSGLTTGALTGAAVGAIASDDGDRLEGAMLGGVAGGAVGAIVDANNNRMCTYRYSDGRSYQAACP